MYFTLLHYGQTEQGGTQSALDGRSPLNRLANRPYLHFACIQQMDRQKMPIHLLVEMIRLELTTYTLRTYRSTG